MPRAATKLLDGLARVFYGAMRVAAALTGASVMVSMVLVLIVVVVIEALVARAGIVAVVVYGALVMTTLFGAVRVAKAYGDAFAKRDFAAVAHIREIIEGKGEPRGASFRALKKIGDGELLIELEKWKEAAEVLAEIDLRAIPKIARPAILAQLGYARAHAGRPDEGIADIERGIQEADAQERYPAAKRFHLVRRHGIALSLAGDDARAIDVLAPLVAGDDFAGSARELAEVYYFLGRAHSAHGDDDAAVAAYACGVSVGKGPYVPRIWKMLEVTLDPLELEALRRELTKPKAN